MAPLEVIRVGIVVLASVFAAGVAVYLGVSFALVRRHCLDRPTPFALRAALTEAFWVVLTQPLLPLFYLVGRRMGGARGGVPVVLVHGYSQNRVNFLRIAVALHKAGSGPIYGFNYPWGSPIDQCAARLAAFVETVCRAHGQSRVDLVCHSLGGVIAIEYLGSEFGQARVRRCVTVASPHAGLTWGGPVVGTSAAQLRRGSAFFQTRPTRRLSVPCLSIASSHDNVVHPPATSALAPHGGMDLIFAHHGHLTLLFAPEVIAAIVGFVQDDAHQVDTARAAA